MADKHATIYVVDVGSTTGNSHNERNETDLEYGLRYFWSKIAETMAAGRTTLSVGVIAFRTNETLNPLETEGYENIAILKNLGQVELADVEKLRSKLVTSNSEYGDAISAVVIAISEIEKFTRLKDGKPGKFTRKIVLLTDGLGMINPDDSEEIIRKINECSIELVVMSE